MKKVKRNNKHFVVFDENIYVEVVVFNTIFEGSEQLVAEELEQVLDAFDIVEYDKIFFIENKDTEDTYHIQLKKGKEMVDII